MFSELHAHSEYSSLRFLDSTVKIGALIDYALKIGLSGVAVTDHECLSGHIKALQHYKEIKDEHPDFKLILGNEIYLINESDYQNTDKFFHFILLAKDIVGHSQLRELSTRAWSRMYTYKRMERVPTFYSDLADVIGNNQGHLIGMSACLGGYLPFLLLNDKFEQAKFFVDWCINLFGKDNFYVELQAGISEEQIEFNKKAIDFCKTNGYSWTFTNDVHYLNKGKRKLHAAYLNSADEDRETDSFYENTYFKTEDEMFARTTYLNPEDVKQGFNNTIKITNDIEFYDLHQDVIVPERKIPDYKPVHLFALYYNKYSYIKKFAESEYPQDRFILYQIEEGFKEKNEIFNDENLSRIDIELKQLWDISIKLNQRISAYYNLSEYIVEIMWDDNKGNSLVGVARGSVTGYYIAYLINITQINPIKWNLPYWRHLVADRPELPDVDIDSQSSQRPQIFQAMKDTFGHDRGLNIITFKRETSKAAIQTACRGLGIDTDTAHEISSLVPITRGKVWSIKECLEGNEDNNYQPVKEFVNKIKEHPMLLETVQEIENLVCGRSSHASGFYLFNDKFVKQNSLMKTPKGIDVTCWDMADSDYCGALKVDFLTIEALDKIRKCMDLLIADGKMEWQGTLRATYNKYLHPNVINYNESKMWKMLENNNIPDLFQFDTLVGGDAVKKIKPTTLKQLSLANSVMRLMGDTDNMPIDRFVRFKNDSTQWDKEMKEANLNDDEIKILKHYLDHNFGCSIEQEDVMELSMDKHIAGFNIVEANKLRKGIAKKKKNILAKVKELFFTKGHEIGTRQEMLDYVWNDCIKPQLGYSFSRNHTLPYSTIGLQEMNLSYYYPIIYWNTACLTINASANEEIEDNKSTNYGKIAKAIGDMQTHGVQIELPEINSAKFEFSPDNINDQIIFGLKGINSIGDDIANTIVQKRPYSSLEDFISKNEIEIKPMINLIKAGCFDKICNISRYEIMKQYIVLLTKQKVETKNSLNMQNFPSIINLNILPKEFDFQKQLYYFKKYVFSKDNMVKKNEYQLDNESRIFFENVCMSYLKENQDYRIDVDGTIIYKNKFDKWYNTQIEELKSWLQNTKSVEKYNLALYNNYATTIWNKYCNGNISKWEMDSLSFYYTKHELADVNLKKYSLTRYKNISREPMIIGKIQRKNRSWSKYQLYNIVGTILDKNANGHYITLLTVDGVVTVKFYSGIFTFYNKRISERKDDGKKTVIEDSWFSRGNKVLITGFRKNDMFYPKRYNDSIYQHTICKINEVYENGDLDLQYEREKGD